MHTPISFAETNEGFWLLDAESAVILETVSATAVEDEEVRKAFALLVRAVNNHDALVAGLEMAERAISGAANPDENTALVCFMTLERIRTTLANATKE